MFCQALVIAAVASVTIASLIVQEQQYNHAPQPYKFGYDIKDKHGEQYRHEEGDGGNAVRGSYGFTDERGIKRHVDYVADHAGFRAQVKTNEPGTANQNPAAVLMISEAPYSLGLNFGGLRYGNGGYNGQSANLGNGNLGYENTGNGYGNLGYENLGNGNLGYKNLGNQNLGNLNLGNQNLGNLNLGYGNLGLGNLGNGNLGLGNLGNGYLKSGNLGYTVGAPGYEYSLGYNGYGLGGYGLGLGMLGGLGYARYGY